MAAGLIYGAAISLIAAVRIARLPYELDYEEGNILNAGARLSAGLTPYPPPRSWPVVLNPYGPIPYSITAAIVRLHGIGFFLPRLAIVLAAFFAAIAIGLIAHHFTADWSLAAIFAAAFLTLRVVQGWTFLLRVDLLGVALSLFGLYVFLRWRLLRIAVPIFCAALLCKVTFLAAPAACAVILIRERRWKELAYALLAGSAILAVIVGWFQWATHGAFLFHQFGTHADPFSWQNYERYMAPVLLDASPLLILALCGVIRLRQVHPGTLYLIATLAGTVTLLKVGSESNHLLELDAALCIAAAVGMHSIERMRSRPALTLVLAILVGFFLVESNLVHTIRRWSPNTTVECPQAYAEIQRHHVILSENVGTLVLGGKPVLLSNPFVYAQLVRSGRWPDGPVEEMLEQRQADLVVIGQPAIMDQRWSETALAALGANYHPTQRFVCPETVVMYEPR